jgi:hypothetical protein
MRVQCVRGVGCVRGYPYFAWGLYEVRAAADGRLFWKLTASSRRFRSDARGRHKFPGVPEARRPVRHNQKYSPADVPPELLAVTNR